MLYVNLIREQRARQARERLTWILGVASVVVVFAVCATLIVTSVMSLVSTREQIASFDKKSGQLEAIAKEVRVNQDALARLRPLYSLQQGARLTSATWMGLLRDVVAATPPNVWLDKVATQFVPATHAHTATLAGHAQSHDDLAILWQALSRRSNFDPNAVTLKGTTPETDPDGTLRSIGFTIEARLQEPVGADFQ